MRLLIALVVVFTFIIGGFFNTFLLDRIDVGILRNQTWHYGASPHDRRINTELTSNPNRIEVVRHQMRSWTPQIMGIAPNATGQEIWQQVSTDGLYFGSTNLLDAQPEHAFQTDVIWEHQGLRPTTGDIFNHHMTAHPTSDNQNLMLFNVGFQGSRLGSSAWVLNNPAYNEYLRRLEHYLTLDYDQLGLHSEIARLTSIVQRNAERVTIHTMHFHPANFEMWAGADDIATNNIAHDQATMSLMSLLRDMEANLESALRPRADTATSERSFNNASVQLERLFNNTPDSDHAGFRAAATFAQSIASQTNEYLVQNFNSPFTQNGSTSMSLAQEFNWIWMQLNSLGLSEETARRTMFIIIASTAVEVDAGNLRQINSRMRIHGSNSRTFTHWVGDRGGVVGEPPFRRGSTTSRYRNWSEAVSERLQFSFGDTASPISRFGTFQGLHNDPTQNGSRLNQTLYWAVRDQRQGNVHSFLVPVSLLEIHLDTVFVIYHLVMGSYGNFTVNGNRMEYLPRNHGTATTDNRDARARFFTYATQSTLSDRTSYEFLGTTRNRRWVRFGEVSPRDDSRAMSGTLWFNRELTNTGRNQALSSSIRAGMTVADMFEDSIVSMHPHVRREIQRVIRNNDLFQHFNISQADSPVATAINSLAILTNSMCL